MTLIRVLLVDDHQLFREGLVNILNNQPDFQVIAEAGDGLEAQIKARKLKPDLILMDVIMPGCDGLEATQRIKQDLPQTIIVMLTVREDEANLFQAIRNGAQGYLLKNISSKDMLDMLRAAVRGEAAITPTLGGRMLEEFRRISKFASQAPQQVEALTRCELEILSLVAAGDTNKEIAAKLQVSIHTVKTHMRKILEMRAGRRREGGGWESRERLPSRLDQRSRWAYSYDSRFCSDVHSSPSGKSGHLLTGGAAATLSSLRRRHGETVRARIATTLFTKPLWFEKLSGR